MKQHAPVQVVVHNPETEEGRRELARRAAEVHAGFVADAIQNLDCPAGQKRKLLQAVMDAVREEKPL